MKLDVDLDLLAASPMIAALDLSMLTLQDLVNLIMQRSEVLSDDPRCGPALRAWYDDDAGPLADLAEEYREAIARRAAAVILLEFHILQPELAAQPPRRIADIGCGYAFFSLFAARTFGAALLLIDREENEARHFGFAEEAAAYSSLDRARRLLEANGVPAERIVTLNPAEGDVLAQGECDLAVSFLACGFHFPVDPYLPFLQRAVPPGGRAILDLRRGRAPAQMQALRGLGRLRDLPGVPKARRVMLTREAA